MEEEEKEKERGFRYYLCLQEENNLFPPTRSWSRQKKSSSDEMSKRNSGCNKQNKFSCTNTHTWNVIFLNHASRDLKKTHLVEHFCRVA